MVEEEVTKEKRREGRSEKFSFCYHMVIFSLNTDHHEGDQMQWAQPREPYSLKMIQFYGE